MTTVAAGATGGETLSGANTISIGIASSDTASVTIERAGVVIFSRLIQHSEILGPWEDGDIFTLTANRGAVDYIIAAYTTGTGLSGAFIDLTDVPSSYAGESGKLVAVTGAEDGLEFLAVSPLDIPIPADNEVGGVNITSSAGYVHIVGLTTVSVQGHDVQLSTPDEASCGDLTFTAGNGIGVGDTYGGSIDFNAGDSSTNGNGETGGGIVFSCGSGGFGGDFAVNTGVGYEAAASGGDFKVVFGASGAGGPEPKLDLSKSTGDYAAANNAQTVTVGNVGPGSASVSIKRWIPITVDGHAGWLPHFGV